MSGIDPTSPLGQAMGMARVVIGILNKDHVNTFDDPAARQAALNHKNPEAVKEGMFDRVALTDGGIAGLGQALSGAGIQAPAYTANMDVLISNVIKIVKAKQGQSGQSATVQINGPQAA